MAERDPDNQMDAEPRIPESLCDDLAETYGTVVDVPQEVDDRVLAMAQGQLARRPLRGRGRFPDGIGTSGRGRGYVYGVFGCRRLRGIVIWSRRRQFVLRR